MHTRSRIGDQGEQRQHAQHSVRRSQDGVALHLAGRAVLFGAGEAGAYPNVATAIGRWIPAAKRTRAWGILGMTSQAGSNRSSADLTHLLGAGFGQMVIVRVKKASAG